MSVGFVEEPLLSLETLLVEASFRGDAAESFLRARSPTPRHHQPAAVPGVDGQLRYRQFSCRKT